MQKTLTLLILWILLSLANISCQKCINLKVFNISSQEIKLEILLNRSESIWVSDVIESQEKKAFECILSDTKIFYKENAKLLFRLLSLDDKIVTEKEILPIEVIQEKKMLLINNDTINWIDEE